MKIRSLSYIATLAAILVSCEGNSGKDINLNGIWQYGYQREYKAEGQVPGIHTDPTAVGEDTLWYRRSVSLPSGDWNKAVLELKGARFRPCIYVNGELASSQEGGMIRSCHNLELAAIAPGNKITLEIALASLKDVPVSDASYVPVADQWRSNCASCLWDDVVLHLYKDARVDRVIARTERDNGTLRMKYRVCGQGAARAVFDICENGKEVAGVEGRAEEGENEVSLEYQGILKEWSPEEPNCYQLKVTLLDSAGRIDDIFTQTLGLKDLRIVDKQFQLNGRPFKVRGGSIVWHRWMRDPEGREVGWNTEWIEKNIVRRLKDHGANCFRFHLGVPPERILDLCDRWGLAVQYEWSFFHGMPACGSSLVEQYGKWLDMAARHPSVSFYHPYNETEGSQLDTVWTALNRILPDYPDLLFEERDVIHVHKYWWSLFEGLGLYYDSAEQFDKAIMVDEFGGNYLDGKGDMGLYPSIKESLMRFLGPEHNASQRYHHQDRSCAKVAEYWRRTGAAGVSPFVIASSQEDGCNWFLGPLREGRPKSVWDALTVLWSPQAASMDIWDCDFTPGQKVIIPIHYFNDCPAFAELHAVTCIMDTTGKCISEYKSEATVGAYEKAIAELELTMPATEGKYLIRTELIDKPAGVKYPVRSDWDIRVLEAKVPAGLKGKKLFIPACESELLGLATRFGLQLSTLENADLALCGRASWPLSGQLAAELGKASKRGCAVVLLDVGENGLGIGYPGYGAGMGDLQGITKLTESKVSTYRLFRSLSIISKELPESESHIHPLANGSTALWEGFDSGITQLWNGLRGGLIVPSYDMAIEGLSADAFLRRWKACGADEKRIKGKEPYFAYDLCGYYSFASRPDDKEVIKELRRKVQFLIDDAPALAIALNSKAPVTVSNLADRYRQALAGEASSLTPLACAGKNLTRTPVVKIGFGKGEGTVIISQLLTEGRLTPPSSSTPTRPGYEKRYDEAAVQLVLNMMAEALN